MTNYRTRFAPSPTGDMHLGHARTALVTWLRARLFGGRVVMRIEDIDTPRVRAGSADAILRDHAWLGLHWDEGPFYQSDRLEHYEAALRQLHAQHQLYPCTCSRKDIAAASAPHGDAGPRYPGTCRQGITRHDRSPAFRFRVSDATAHPAPGFVDAFHGGYPAQDAQTLVHLDDFIVRRSDGLFAYQLAVVVDDAAMNISEVIRGDDLLSSTPRQLALYKALSQRAPSFLHLPLGLDIHGKRLAKRTGACSLAEYRAQGASAEHILGWLAHSLGLADTSDPVSLHELKALFGPEHLTMIPKTAFAFRAYHQP